MIPPGSNLPPELAEALSEIEGGLDAALDLPPMQRARRDTFATAALVGLLADSSVDTAKTSDGTFARSAYSLADAMLEARSAKPEDPKDSESWVPRPLVLRLARRCLVEAFRTINLRGPVAEVFEESKADPGSPHFADVHRAFRVLGGLDAAETVAVAMRTCHPLPEVIASVYSDADILARLEEIAE